MITETDFPYGEIADRYAKEFILPWFKRCVEDFPKVLTPEMHQSGDYIWVNPQKAANWFVKWFSQFIEKGEENES